MKHTSRKPKRTSRNPGIDTKLYSVIDRMTGFERRHLTKEQAKLTLDAHEDRCSRHGWRSEARVYYRDGADVTREFRGGGMGRNPRLTEAQRSRLPLSVFVFPERRTFPLESEAAAYDAIRMLRLGRVKSASDFKAVTDAIRAKYPAAWKKYGAGLSWPKTKAAKALGSKRRAATVAKKKRTSRMAANADRRWWGVWTGKEHRMNVLAPSEADAIAQFERKTRGMVFLPGGAVSARLLDEPPRGRSAPMPLPHWKPSRNPASATFPGTLSGYHAAHNWLVQHGFHPVPGSSRYEDGMRRTGRIVDAGRDYRVEVEKRLGRNSASIAESAPWRVRDRLTRHRYYFQSRSEAERFIESVSTSEITGEPLRQWAVRLVAEKNV